MTADEAQVVKLLLVDDDEIDRLAVLTAHGGWVDVHSTAQSGTIFSVHLPHHVGASWPTETPIHN